MVLAPFQVDFDITLDCMYKCKHCNVDAGDKLENELTHEEIITILNQLNDIGVSDVSITGGEPLLRSDCLDILKHAASIAGFNLTLNTNGLLVDEKLIEFLEEKCPNINIAVSIDGHTAETYSILRKSKFNKEKVLVEEFNKVREALMLLGKSRLNVGANFTLTSPTIDNIWDTYKFIKELNINNMLAIKFFPYGQGEIYKNELELSYFSWNEFLIDATDKKINDPYYKGFQISVTCPWEIYMPLLEAGYSIEQVHKIWDYNSPLESELYRKKRNIGCHAGITSCAISPNGDLYPCGTISSKYPPFVCGNLKDQTLEDIWYNSEVLDSLRKLDINELEGECIDCKYVDLCGGGCRARAHTKYSTFTGIDYLCPIHKKKEEEK